MSFPFVTVIVAAGVPVALNTSTEIPQTALILIFVFILFSILLGKFLDKTKSDWVASGCAYLGNNCASFGEFAFLLGLAGRRSEKRSRIGKF